MYQTNGLQARQSKNRKPCSASFLEPSKDQVECLLQQSSIQISEVTIQEINHNQEDWHKEQYNTRDTKELWHLPNLSTRSISTLANEPLMLLRESTLPIRWRVASEREGHTKWLTQASKDRRGGTRALSKKLSSLLRGLRLMRYICKASNNERRMTLHFLFKLKQKKSLQKWMICETNNRKTMTSYRAQERSKVAPTKAQLPQKASTEHKRAWTRSKEEASSEMTKLNLMLTSKATKIWVNGWSPSSSRLLESRRWWQPPLTQDIM